MKTYFKLDRLENTDEGTGAITIVDTLVKYTDKGDGTPPETEPWIDVQELNSLFDTCVKKWGDNWDLEKVQTAITECDFD